MTYKAKYTMQRKAWPFPNDTLCAQLTRQNYKITFRLNDKKQILATVFPGKDSEEAQKLFYAAYWEQSPVIVSVVKIQQP
jgi:hypothetical protein